MEPWFLALQMDSLAFDPPRKPLAGLRCQWIHVALKWTLLSEQNELYNHPTLSFQVGHWVMHLNWLQQVWAHRCSLPQEIPYRLPSLPVLGPTALSSFSRIQTACPWIFECAVGGTRTKRQAKAAHNVSQIKKFMERLLPGPEEESCSWVPGGGGGNLGQHVVSLLLFFSLSAGLLISGRPPPRLQTWPQTAVGLITSGFILSLCPARCILRKVF